MTRAWAKVAGSLSAAAVLGGAQPGPQPQNAGSSSCSDQISRWITLRNLTQSIVYRVHERSPGDAEWQDFDKLGDVALLPGQSVRMAMSQADCRCSSDLRVEFFGDAPERVFTRVSYCGGTTTLDVD